MVPPRITTRDCGGLAAVVAITTGIEAWLLVTRRPPLTRQFGVLLSHPGTRYPAVAALCVGVYHLLLEASPSN